MSDGDGGPGVGPGVGLPSAGRGAGRPVDSAELAMVLDELAATVTTDFTLHDVLRKLLRGVTRVLDIDGAGVATPGGGGVGSTRLAFASEGPVGDLERVQDALQDGPCRACLSSGQVINLADLAIEGSWPAYQQRAHELGIQAVAAIPLRGRGHLWGVLDIYRSERAALSVAELGAVTTLANLATSYLVVAHDRDVAREAQAELTTRAMQDALTGLPVRWVFLEHLERALARLARVDARVAVLFVDLDGLKWVNDMHGHAAGDRLILATAQRIRAALRPSDVLARIGGDEFVVLLEDLEDAGAALDVARRMLETLAQPLRPDGYVMHPSASVGVATSTTSDMAGATLIAHADSAMYQAKRQGPGGVREFDASSHARERDASAAVDRLVPELRKGIADGQIEVHYQPIVLLGETGDDAPRLHAVEALARWRHPERGLLNASEFIDAAERSGLVTELGAVVMQQACLALSGWQREVPGREPGHIFVNVATSELVDPGFVGRVCALLEEAGLSAERLTLEITETGLMRQPLVAASTLRELRQLGCGVAIDDFGTGWSSLSRLLDVPATTIKIDQSFTAGLDTDPHAAAVVSTIRTLGEQLGRDVVAEGVESEQSLRTIAGLGVRLVQGYHLGRPVDEASLRRRLESEDW